MKEAIGVLKALSNDTRVRIMRVLIESKRELCICEIMDSLKLPQYNISKHIRELKIAGLVMERKEGQFVFYAFVPHKGRFYQLLLQTLEEIDAGIIKQDKQRMKKRLALRVSGKCVVGMRGR
jgi:ArsR family transcriptional regulator, arsenate/arsenite/antimonite-responsive transcriptional repressor